MRKKNTASKQDGLIEAVHLLCKEKNISEEMIYSTIEDAVKAAYKKNLPKDAVEPMNIVAQIDRTTGTVHVYARLLVAEEVENPAVEISLTEARKIRANAEINDLVDKDVTPVGFLRVAAQTAKGVIMQRIRQAERTGIYDEYAEKTDEILTGIVQRRTDSGVIVELGHTEGYLDNDEMIPGEEIKEGDHIKVYVLHVARGDAASLHGPQVRVSRKNPALVRRLFEMEVPEIAAGQVTIKSLARKTGIRTKMAVHSNDPMIDPVGACVGQRGGRVERVVEELKGEKIDIIKWSEDPAEFVANALNPAHVLTVYVHDTEKSCRVVVPDNQLSLAIGKEGMNAALAAKLTGWKIDIKSQSQAAEMTDMVDESVRAETVLTPMEYDPNAVIPMDDDTI